MRENLHRFFRAARGAGVRLSPAESIDAMRAVADVGFSDRGILRDTLLLTLAKTEDEKKAVGDCFDLFFDSPEPRQAAPEQAANDPTGTTQARPAEAAGGQSTGAIGPLAELLLSQDRSEMAAAIARASNAAALPDIRYFTQRGIFSGRILDQMGIARLRDDLDARRHPGAGRRSRPRRWVEVGQGGPQVRGGAVADDLEIGQVEGVHVELFEEVGYWWCSSSSAGSVTFRTVVPPVTSPVTDTCAYPVLRPSGEVAVAVMTSLPNPIGTLAENDPSGAATVLVTDGAAPVVVSAEPTSTEAPGEVVPVTVVVVDPIVAPEAGAVMARDDDGVTAEWLKSGEFTVRTDEKEWPARLLAVAPSTTPSACASSPKTDRSRPACAPLPRARRGAQALPPAPARREPLAPAPAGRDPLPRLQRAAPKPAPLPGSGAPQKREEKRKARRERRAIRPCVSADYLSLRGFGVPASRASSGQYPVFSGQHPHFSGQRVWSPAFP